MVLTTRKLSESGHLQHSFRKAGSFEFQRGGDFVNLREVVRRQLDVHCTEIFPEPILAWWFLGLARSTADVAEALYSGNRRVPTYTKSQITPLKNNYNGATPDPGYVSGHPLLVTTVTLKNEASAIQEYSFA